MDVTVCIGTYGETSWIELAQRAIASARPQARVIHCHEETLAVARNAALEQVTTEWVVFLDADDELDPGYVAAMSTGTADLRAPYLQQHRRGAWRTPFMPQVWGHTHACEGACLRHGNYIVIGACVRAALVREVGGFWEERVYEDWSLWLRCYLAGASVETIPSALYKAHMRPGSRNHSLPKEEMNRIHYEIVSSIGPDAVAPA